MNVRGLCEAGDISAEFFHHHQVEILIIKPLRIVSRCSIDQDNQNEMEPEQKSVLMIVLSGCYHC